MSEVRAVALALLALVGAFAVVAPASLAGPVQASPTGAGVTASTAGVAAPASTSGVGAAQANDTSMGGQISSFMHASSGQADEEVEAGMWNAAYENAPNRTAIVDSRTTSIASRLADLRERKQQLIDAREDGAISPVEYQARMSDIVGRMAALNRSIDDTSRQARASGVDPARVERLRADASNVTGPEVAETARSFAGGPPEGIPADRNGTGPPDHAGPPDGGDEPGNAEQGPPGNESAPGEGNGGGSGEGPGEGNGGPPGEGNSDGPGEGNSDGPGGGTDGDRGNGGNNGHGGNGSGSGDSGNGGNSNGGNGDNGGR